MEGVGSVSMVRLSLVAGESSLRRVAPANYGSVGGGESDRRSESDPERCETLQRVQVHSLVAESPPVFKRFKPSSDSKLPSRNINGLVNNLITL